MKGDPEQTCKSNPLERVVIWRSAKDEGVVIPGNGLTDAEVGRHVTVDQLGAEWQAAFEARREKGLALQKRGEVSPKT